MNNKVSENSSKDAELRKLTQAQLIQIVFTLQQQQRKLIAERNMLKKKVQELSAQKSGSNSADTASTAPEIVKQAQQTAKKSLELVRDMNEKAQIANNEIIESATRQASQILKDAEIKAQQILNAANIQAAGFPSGVQPMPSALDLLDEELDEFLLDETYTVPQAKDFLENVDDDGAYGYLPKLPYEAQFIEELNKLGLDYDDLDEDFLFDLSGIKEEEAEEDLQIKPEDILAPTVMVRIGEEKEWENEEEEDDSSKPLSPDLFSDYDPLEESEEYIKAYQAILDGKLGSVAENESTPPNAESAIQADPDLAASASQLDLSEADASATDPSAPLEVQDDDSAASAKTQESSFSMGDTEAFEPLDPSISGILSMTKAERKAAKKAAKAAKAARKAAKRTGNPRLEKMKAQEAAQAASSDENTGSNNAQPQETTEHDALDAKQETIEESVSDLDTIQSATTQSQEAMMNKAREMLKTRTVPEIMQASYENFTNVNRVQESMYSDFDYDMCFDDTDSFNEATEVDSEEKIVD